MIIGIDARCLFTTPRTGVGEFTFELLSHLFERETTHQFILFTNAFKKNDVLPFFTFPHVSWVYTTIPNKLFHVSISLLRRPRLDRYVANKAGVKNIDIWFSPNLLFTSLSPQTTHILTIHDLSFEHYPHYFSQKARMWHRAVHPKKQIEHARHIIVPSEHTKRDVVHTFQKDPDIVHVFPPGLCSDIQKMSDEHRRRTIQKKYNLPEHYMLFLGTLESRKNLGSILDAYEHSAYLRTRMPLIFAGALGYRGDSYVKRIQNISTARYIGYVQEEEKQTLYAGARALIYPSMYEGFGFPVLEALACGTPVIASNRASLPAVVGHGGILVNSLNTKQLGDAMERLMTDDTLYTQLSEEGRKHAGTYSWDRAAVSLLTLFDTIH